MKETQNGQRKSILMTATRREKSMKIPPPLCTPPRCAIDELSSFSPTLISRIFFLGILSCNTRTTDTYTMRVLFFKYPKYFGRLGISGYIGQNFLLKFCHCVSLVRGFCSTGKIYFLPESWKLMLNFSIFSDGGCLGQSLLLFWKLIDETQMPKPQECTDTFILT